MAKKAKRRVDDQGNGADAARERVPTRVVRLPEELLDVVEVERQRAIERAGASVSMSSMLVSLIETGLGALGKRKGGGAKGEVSTRERAPTRVVRLPETLLDGEVEVERKKATKRAGADVSLGSMLVCLVEAGLAVVERRRKRESSAHAGASAA